ncbi:MAG: HAD family hydrolase [Phycisphaerae bacterium]
MLASSSAPRPPSQLAPWQASPQAPLPPDVAGLIFDLDGTLVDTMPVHYRAWMAALEPHGLNLPEARFYSLAGAPTVKIAEILCREQAVAAEPQAIAAQKEAHYLAHIAEIKRIEPVIALAKAATAAGLKISVASGGHRNVVSRQLAAAGLGDMFAVVACADDVEHGKPAPDTFLLAAKRMGVSPQACIVYEDAELGFQAAQAANMRCVDVRPWYGGKAAESPDHRLPA